MPSYYTNAEITQPINTGLTADVDLGGLKFSYEHGPFYTVGTNTVEVTLPPVWTG